MWTTAITTRRILTSWVFIQILFAILSSALRDDQIQFYPQRKIRRDLNTQSKADIQRILEQVMSRYQIGASVISFRGTNLTMTFPLNDMAPDGSVAIKTYSDTNCTVDISENTFLVPEILYDNDPNPDGSKNRQITVQYTIDPMGIQQSDVWVQSEEKQYFMNFCVEIGLKEDGSATSNIMSSLETIVHLKVDLLGDFGVTAPIMPAALNEEVADQVYYVPGYLCDDNNKKIIYQIPQRQGSLVRVCVTPTAAALADGVYMRSVQSFTFQRDSGVAGTKITQSAVEEGRSANEGTTQLYCEMGVELCYFTTMLTADFYFRPGTVEGFGEAWLQFGRGQTRRLQITTRKLQVDGGFAGSAVFNLRFFAIPEGFGLGAVAFECNDKNLEVKSPPPKEWGDTIRVCITPDEASQKLGITINRIESWNFTRPDVSQAAVEVDGVQAKDGLTILVCVPGSNICIFRTQFVPDMFGSNGIVAGLGTVVLQYGLLEDISVSRRLALGSSETERFLQDVTFDSIAGKAPVKLDTDVIFAESTLPAECEVEQKLTEWWLQESLHDRYMYIGLSVGSLLAIAASLLICWLCPCCFRRQDEVEETEDGIKVHVDVTADKRENRVSHVKNSRKHSKSVTMHRESETTDESTDDSKTNKKKRSSSSKSLVVPEGRELIGPSSSDVVFNDGDHPGTKNLTKIIRSYVKSNPDIDYGPDSYRAIKKQMDGSQFLLKNEADQYFEPSKKEVIDQIGDIFYDAKGGSSHTRKIRRSGSGRSLDDLESASSRRTLERKGSSRRSLCNQDDGERSSSRKYDERKGSSRRSLSSPDDGEASSNRKSSERRESSRRSLSSQDDLERERSSRKKLERKESSRRSLSSRDDEERVTSSRRSIERKGSSRRSVSSKRESDTDNKSSRRKSKH